MILPGISGAYILVLLGKYRFVLAAVNDRDILTLAVIIAGATVGILTFARFLSWLFSRYHDLTVAALTGLMLGSLRKVWPWKAGVNGNDPALPATLDSEVVVIIAIMTTGLLTVFLVAWLASRSQPPLSATPSPRQ
jgi:putative membrane protein